MRRRARCGIALSTIGARLDERRGCRIRPRGRARLRRARTADHLGHRSQSGGRHFRPRARSRRISIRTGAPRRRARSPIWGLRPGTPLAGLPVNRVFIGSCTNSRLPDLQVAAAVVRGRRVAEGVVAMVVPGSTTVKREAEAAGLDRVFRDAGFFWGESGCSMCAGGNGDRGAPGERCVSTTNRNFEHRQGPKVRTHSGESRRLPRRPRSPGASPTCGNCCREWRDGSRSPAIPVSPPRS